MKALLRQPLRPWLDQVVVIGGWAHHLYRLHTFAQHLRYEPLATLDADIALPTRFKVTGDEIYKRLASNGFKAEFLGHHKPPAAHYRLSDSGPEFYAEFVAPLAGSTVSRTGKPKATHRVGGVSLQNLRYVEVLLATPWSVTLSASNGFPLANETRVQIANPVSFIVQKILIHRRRKRDGRAKDILYMQDTIDTFATRIDDLRAGKYPVRVAREQCSHYRRRTRIAVWRDHRLDSRRIANRPRQGSDSRSDSGDMQSGVHADFPTRFQGS